MGNFKNILPGFHSRSRSTRYGSFATGRPGLRESANIDFSTPGFGSVQISDGRYFWVAFTHLSDWLEGGEPLDSGYHANEGKAHNSARAAVRYLLNERETLPPMPEEWVAALHRRLMEHDIMQEQVARWMAVLEREDGTIAGYEWTEVCQANDYDLLGFDDPDEDVDSLQSIDEDIDQAA